MDNIAATSPHQTNRLRAATALIPIIEAGLRDSKMSRDRAAHLAVFCEWSIDCTPSSDEERKLHTQLSKQLEALKRYFD